jgi:hypothetical protein
MVIMMMVHQPSLASETLNAGGLTMWKLTILAAVGTIVVFSALNLTIFVVAPIGALPEGRTVILWRNSKALSFIDSADAVCDRTSGGVSLLCRGLTLAAVIKANPVLLRLPYSDTLYSISTNGKRWEH